MTHHEKTGGTHPETDGDETAGLSDGSGTDTTGDTHGDTNSGGAPDEPGR